MRQVILEWYADSMQEVTDWMHDILEDGDINGDRVDRIVTFQVIQPMTELVGDDTPYWVIVVGEREK